MVVIRGIPDVKAADMADMRILKVKYQLDETSELLNKFSMEFDPPLSSRVDIKAYAEKLSRYANFLIAEEQNRVIGYLAFYKNQNAMELYITSLCVSNTYRGKGIGKKLLDHLCNIGLSEGYPSISLEVRKNNKNAFGFYKKMQFEISQTRSETILMNKRISSCE